MKFHYFFKHIDSSEALMEHADEKLLRVCRFLLKDGKGEVYFSKSKLDWKIDITIRSAHGHFAARAKAENLYMAVDMAADKLEKQLLKRKTKVQHHKNYEKSREGRLELLNESLEMDGRPFQGLFKKAA